MSKQLVEISHDGFEGTGKVPVSALPRLKAQGWNVVGDEPVDPAELKGKDLDAALEKAGLSKDGTAEEKRTRLAEHVTGPQ